MAHEPIAPRGNQIMNRRLNTLTFSLSLLLLAAARPTRAADGLAYVGTQHDGGAGVNGLRSAQALALSPDGAHLYAAGSGDSALVVFMRDATAGTLTVLGAETGLNGPQAIAISPDGAQLYVAAGNDIAIYARDPASGMLTFVETVKDNTNGVDGLAGAAALALS